MELKAFSNYLALEKKYSAHTVKAYIKDVEEFSIFCKNELDEQNINTVSYPVIRSWVVCLVENGVSNRSINRKTASLKAYYKFLQGVGLNDSNPLLKHRALKTSKKVQIPFSESEMDSLLSNIQYPDTFEGTRDRLMIQLMYETGMRRAELIHMKLSGVDLNNGLVKVLGKRNKERIIPLLPDTCELMRVYLDQRRQMPETEDSNYVMVLKSGYKLYETLVYRTINRYLSKVSLKVKKSPHILRHTFATHLLNKGADMNSVKELLGHSSLASTQVYTHNSIAELKKVHAKAHPRGKK
ncbi:tyrosine-type recombinase/integrase [Euzebyella saccharophila]|uniref:Tyrosine-type recombinase/integrase n=1 Tax=Euzebyella saccharophila TaxID=679664 RepID=A0ABV8JT33_9FLAO|nr:tyrosine-type recombinase/integrase [Euzebyella saccharophila]